MSTLNIPYFTEDQKDIPKLSQFASWHGTIINPCPAPAFANSVDPDQLASEEANWSRSTLSAIKYVNLY